MTDDTILVGGVTIYARRPASGTEGAAAGSTTPPYVIVPGIGMSHRYSERLHRELGGTRPAFSLDIPGFGHSGGRDGGKRRRLAVGEYARLIARALDERGLVGTVLIGHSMGAQFAAEIALTRPDLVSCLVLAAPVVDPARRTALRQTLAMARDLAAEPPSASAVVIGDFLRTGPRYFLTEMRSMLDHPTEAAVRAVGCPVLVMRGENDPIARRAWCGMLAAAAADGHLVEIPRARHLLQHTRPGEVARAIEAFAARVEATA